MRRGPLACPAPADQVEYRKSVLVGDYRLTVDQARARRQTCDCRGDQGKAIGKIVAIAGEKSDAGAVSARHDAEAVMLDFVNPVWPSRRLIDTTGQARLDEVGSRARTQTQRHAV